LQHAKNKENRAAVVQTPVNGTSLFRFGPEYLQCFFCNSDEELAGLWLGNDESLGGQGTAQAGFTQ
jgi:hypothetical protein